MGLVDTERTAVYNVFTATRVNVGPADNDTGRQQSALVQGIEKQTLAEDQRRSNFYHD